MATQIVRAGSKVAYLDGPHVVEGTPPIMNTIHMGREGNWTTFKVVASTGLIQDDIRITEQSWVSESLGWAKLTQDKIAELRVEGDHIVARRAGANTGTPVFNVSFVDDKVAYATSGNNLLKSIDGGLSWRIDTVIPISSKLNLMLGDQGRPYVVGPQTTTWSVDPAKLFRLGSLPTQVDPTPAKNDLAMAMFNHGRFVFKNMDRSFADTRYESQEAWLWGESAECATTLPPILHPTRGHLGSPNMVFPWGDGLLVLWDSLPNGALYVYGKGAVDEVEMPETLYHFIKNTPDLALRAQKLGMDGFLVKTAEGLSLFRPTTSAARPLLERRWDKLAIHPPSLDTSVGKRSIMGAQHLPAGCAQIWTSSAPEVVSVQFGKLVALQAGESTITLSVGDEVATALVRVSL